MADVGVFEYRGTESLLQRYDARHKLPALVAVAAGLLRSPPLGLLAMSGVVACAALSSRVPLAGILRQLRGFSAILVLALVAEAFSVPGARIAPGLPATAQGVESGALLAWRLGALIVAGALFAGSTSVSMVRSAVAWYLRPFPFVPAGRIATMLSLTVTFIPLVFDTYRGIHEAALSRGMALRRNPLRSARIVAVPLLIRCFSRTDAVVSAMEARCYVDERTVASLRSRPEDWAITLGVAGVTSASLFWLR